MPLRFLLTNDDGIEAPGLAALAEAAGALGEVVIVAPHIELSGCGHRVTVDRPLHLQELGNNRFRLEGTPADCVRVALTHLKLEVDFVLSGINPGGNLGCDVYMSGTVAAVREAALFHVPGVAISQFRRTREPVDWRRACRWTAALLPQLISLPKREQCFWNVNLPDPPCDASTDEAPCPPAIRCSLDTHPLAFHYEAEDRHLIYRGRYQERNRTPDRDIAVCFEGAVAITKLALS